MTLNRSLFSSKDQNWGTPPDLFRSLNRLFRFQLDACAVAKTAKCPIFTGPDGDGLNRSWAELRTFCNPPYSDVSSWIRKARNEAVEARGLSVNLIPARHETAWWSVGVLSEDGAAGKLLRSRYDPNNRTLWLRWQGLITGIHQCPGRLAFEGPAKSKANAPFPSAVVMHFHPGVRPPKLEGIASGWML